MNTKLAALLAFVAAAGVARAQTTITAIATSTAGVGDEISSIIESITGDQSSESESSTSSESSESSSSSSSKSSSSSTESESSSSASETDTDTSAGVSHMNGNMAAQAAGAAVVAGLAFVSFL
ncbi:hypothetical protein IWQ60_000117 [Tieghemiomyces parasiticus]|uniref:Uncharacterized protein n=1 Tax=Tieghemiomyces parasiticus TaxID=78921 RepID=A0A9W8AJ21_9FUNG|nr:hypothetical protein IWQ60_000117 [Tieghemiomyces parasiticus]